MSNLSGFGHGIAQGGDERRGGVQGRGRGAISRMLKSWLAADGFGWEAGSGLESSIIERKIEEILVLSAYSNEVI